MKTRTPLFWSRQNGRIAVGWSASKPRELVVEVQGGHDREEQLPSRHSL
jgi:hypothetical protein